MKIMIKRIKTEGFGMINVSGKQKSIFCLIFLSLFFMHYSVVQSNSDSIPMLSFEDEEIPKIVLEDDQEIPRVALEHEEIPLLSFEDLEQKKESQKMKRMKKPAQLQKKVIIIQKPVQNAPVVNQKKEASLRVEKPIDRAKPHLISQPKESKQVAQQPRSRLVVKEDSMLDLTKTAPDSLKVSKDKKESPLLLSSEWKEMMQEDFYKKTKYISEIVNQGEEDPQEKEEFVDRFQKNKEWISASLAATTTVADHYFDALMQRKERIDILVKTQRQADILIHKMTMIKKVSESVQSKLRLAVLYALNDLISSTHQVPSFKKIEALVEEKAFVYGTLKDKKYAEAEPNNILNAELMHEIKKLKKRLAKESKKHVQEYEAIKKELEAKERLAAEIKIKNEQVTQDLDAKNLTLKMQEAKVKDAELKTSLMQQVQKETEFNAHHDMEATNKRSLLLEISLGKAEKEKFEAEKSLRKALSDYKEVKELVSLLQKQTDELSSDNQTLLLNLERTVQEKSTLALEKQHAQRQFDRLKKEIAQLQDRLVDQKKQMDRLQITLEKAGNEKKYVLSQVTTMKSMQKRQKETEQKLEARVASLHQSLDASSKKNLELSQLISALKEEYRLTLEQIKEIELLRNESLENSTLLRKEISRLLKSQTRQKVRSEELASLLEKGSMPRKEKKSLKKELLSLKASQEQTGVELGFIQDLYQTEQLQQDNLSTILQEMKSQIFDQEGQLEELEKRSAEKAAFVVPTDKDLIEDEGRLTSLKRKNRALKNKIKALERSMQSKNASKEEEYFAKDHTKVRPEQEIDEIPDVTETKETKKPEKEVKKTVELPKKEEKLKEEKKEVEKKPISEKEVTPEEKKDEASKKPARPMEEIVGSFGQSKKGSIAPTKKPVQQRSMPKPPASVQPSNSPVAPIAPPQGSPLPPQPQQQPSNNPTPELNKDEAQSGMKEVVDAMQKGIQDDPAAFREMMMNAAGNITEGDVIEAQQAIEGMSPAEKEEFTAFVGSMMEAMPPEFLSGEMFQPKK